MENESLLIPIKNEYYFWLFGLINNITFILLTTASIDILPKNIALINLCAIAPVFIVKVTFQFIIKYKFLRYNYRVFILTILYLVSYLLIYFSKNVKVILSGIVLSGIASGIGEITFIPIASVISNKCISYWSSGSGFAGIIGSGYYLVATQIFSIKSNIAILLLSWLPIIIIIFYKKLEFDNENIEYLNYNNINKQEFTLWIKKFIMPLLLVYFFEYSINLTTYVNLIKFGSKIYKSNVIFKSYYFTYQFGVLVSRSMKLIFPNIKPDVIWIFPILQALNLISFTLFVNYSIIPNITLIFILIFYEGILGGLSYLFIFLKIKEIISEDKKEICTSITTIGEVSGQILATIYSILYIKFM